MGISKAQAAALADNFLNDIGSSDKSGLQPRETFTEIILIAGEFVEAMQDNLNKSHTNASGALSASIVATEPVQEGNTLSIDISMLKYGPYQNKGVKGRKSGSSKAGYSFKHDKPGQSMIDAISAWQKSGKAKIANTNTKKTTSGYEKKNASISKLSSDYAIAQSIINKGIKATGFIDKAAEITEKKVSDRLGGALKIDLLNSLVT